MRCWTVATVIFDAAAARAPRRIASRSRSLEHVNETDLEEDKEAAEEEEEEEEEEDEEEEDACVRTVAIVLSQRVRLLRLWGWLATVPVWHAGTQSQVCVCRDVAACALSRLIHLPIFTKAFVCINRRSSLA